MGQNCWEFMGCGRQEGGNRATEYGVCPVYTARNFNGTHGGRNAGRVCWVVAGTLCGGRIQGTFAEKERNCLLCEFYKAVRKEEMASGTFKTTAQLMKNPAA